MKNYHVYLDVTFTGFIEVQAQSKKEVKEIINNFNFSFSNVRCFSHVKTKVLEIN